MFGDNFSSRRSTPFKHLPRERPETAERKKKPTVDNVVGAASSGVSAAATGLKLGTKAVPYLAAVPGVGPALAAGAPAAGAAIAGLIGAYSGSKAGKGTAAKNAKDMPDDIKKLRQGIAKHYSS